jgi:hypothetical protein
LFHHDDAKREYAYDVESEIETFIDALMTEAKRGLDCCQHERRLENHLSACEMKPAIKLVA